MAEMAEGDIYVYISVVSLSANVFVVVKCVLIVCR